MIYITSKKQDEETFQIVKNRYIFKGNILDELRKEFQKNGLGEYNKNNSDIFEKVTKDRKIHNAIRNCEYMENLNKNGQAFIRLLMD